MAANERQPGVVGPSSSQLASLSLIALSGHCCCVWPFVRTNFGRDALFPSGPAAMVLMLLYTGFGNCPEMFYVFLPLWCLAIGFQRIRTLARNRRGVVEHSRFLGDPWLARKLWPFSPHDDYPLMVLVEPLLALAAGGLIYATCSVPLGQFFMAAAASLFVRTVMERAILNARLRSWQDKDIEMRTMAAHFRNRR